VGEGWKQWERGGEGEGEGGRRGIWCKKCAHLYVNAKMRPVETVPGMGEGGIKQSSGGGEFKYQIFDTL
jgi:hypothetical protein